MKLSNLGVAFGIATATIGLAAQASDLGHASKGPRHMASGMQAVAVAPRPGEPGHGWRYFSDPRRARAVVISPDGTYYHSHGDGLQLVHKSAPAA